MRDYVEELATRVAEAARDVEHSVHRSQLTRRLTVTGGCIVAVAVGIAVAGSAGTSGSARASELPILSTDPVDAAKAAPRLRKMVPRATDLRTARAIETPYGTGFVFLTAGGRQLCLAIPDTVPDSFGQTCAPTATVKRKGLSASLVSPDPASPPSEVVVILPAGIASATSASRGERTMVVARDGVVALTVEHDSVISWQSPDGTQSVSVPGHEPQGPWTVDCGDGVMRPMRTDQHPWDVCGAPPDRPGHK